MLQVISRFNATLNDCDEDRNTQLFTAVLSTDVESVRFLLLQNGILVNKYGTFMYAAEEAAAWHDSELLYDETPLYRAEVLRVDGEGGNDPNDAVSDDELSKRNEVVELLRDAGGRTESLMNISYAEDVLFYGPTGYQ